jgi:peptide deformylase
MIVKTEKELREKCPEFDFDNPIVDPLELKKELIEAMFLNSGLGVSANQIGYKTRVFAMRGETKATSVVCFNPIIKDFSPEMNTMEEGCLSLPDVFVRVVRPSHVAIQYLNELQEEEGQLADGLTGRVFQHELDHLDGILMIDRVGEFSKKRAFEKAKKIQKMRSRGKEKFKARFAL